MQNSEEGLDHREGPIVSIDMRCGPELALDRRGLLDLRKDQSSHRRFASLYDDLLT